MSGPRIIDQEGSIQSSSATFMTGDIASYGRSDMAHLALSGLQSITSKFLVAIQTRDLYLTPHPEA